MIKKRREQAAIARCRICGETRSFDTGYRDDKGHRHDGPSTIKDAYAWGAAHAAVHGAKGK